MNMFLRHVRGSVCVGSAEMVTDKVRKEVEEDAFTRYSRRARQVVGQVRDVQNEARAHMLTGQKDERRVTRKARQTVGADIVTRKRYRANQSFSQKVATRLSAADDQRRSRAIGLCKLIPDVENRATWVAMATKYGEYWKEGCTGPPRYTPVVPLALELDEDE